MTDIYLDGALRERWDDTARVYTEWDENGQETSTRPYTEAENAAADARVQAEMERSNATTIRTTTAADLDALATSIANLNAVVDKTNAEITAADTKAVAREARAVARATRRLVRLVLQNFDSVE